MESDFILIYKMKKGNDEAFNTFINKYYQDILSYCYFRCYDQGVSEDLTQETFIKFFSHFSEYNHIGKAKNYLYTIAGNLCKNYYKKAKEIPITKDELIEVDDMVVSDSGQVLTKIMVESALKQLPLEIYEVVMLYYFQGLKLKEISDTLSITLPLVKYRLKRAKELLSKLLEKEDS